MAETGVATNGAVRRRSVFPLPLIIAITAVVVLAVAGGVALGLRDGGFLRGNEEREMDVSLSSARASYEAGDYATAEIQLKSLVGADAENLDARRVLALALTAQGKNDEALEQYTAIIKADSADQASLYEMAIIEQRIGKAQEAIAHLESAVKIEPDASCYRALAPIYASVGKWTESIDAWTAYLGLTELNERGQAEVHAAMSSVYDGMREYEKAKAELEQALVLDPGNEQYKSQLKGYAN